MNACIFPQTAVMPDHRRNHELSYPYSRKAPPHVFQSRKEEKMPAITDEYEKDAEGAAYDAQWHMHSSF